MSFQPIQKISIAPLSEEQIIALSNRELCERMDEILDGIQKEWLPNAEQFISNLDPMAKLTHTPRIAHFMDTKSIQELNPEHQRESLILAFEFLAELQILERISGFSNHFIYNENYDFTKSWQSPLIQIRHAAIQQSTIILSRVAFEKFMNLVYYIEEKDILAPGRKKSKLQEFLNHLVKKKNDRAIPLGYFAPLLSKVRAFDNSYRTGEVHKRSGTIRRLIRMQIPTNDIQNQLELLNICLSVWRPLIDLLSHNHVNYVSGIDSAEDFLSAFIEGGEKYADYIKQISLQE
jgi:hypothetical protein